MVHAHAHQSQHPTTSSTTVLFVDTPQQTTAIHFRGRYSALAI